MKPSDWNIRLAPATPWQTAYAAVQEEVEALSWPHANVTTNELVEALYPLTLASGDGITARNRIYKALKQLATRGLQDYCTKATIPNRYGKFGWLWHARNVTGQHTRNYEKLFEWIGPYLAPDDVSLGRTEFLGTLSDRIVDDLEALERNVS